jgi:hypothetical protein
MSWTRFRPKSKEVQDSPKENQDGTSKATIKGAWIAAGATILAAIIGAFALVHAGSTNGPPTTTSTSGPLLGITESAGSISITSVSLETGVHGEVIAVSGIASRLGDGATLYAVARPSAESAGTWQASQGVQPASNGRWATKIDLPTVPSQPYTVQVVDVPSQSCPPGEVCAEPPPLDQLMQFGADLGEGTAKSNPATVTP